MRRLVRRAKQDRGAAAVEFALVAIVLIPLLLGIVQFGFTFFQYLECVHAAREGVRWAALGEINSSDVRTRVTAAAPGLNPPLGAGNITVAVDGAAVTRVDRLIHQGRPASVTVVYGSPVFVPFLGELFGGDEIQLTSTATMRVE